MTHHSTHEPAQRPWSPGFLLGPLEWVTSRTSRVLATSPMLLAALFELDLPRMHLTALALANLEDELTYDMVLFLLQGSRPAVLQQVLGRQIPGLRRAFTVLPNKVLHPTSYRMLVDLFADREIARFLNHAPAISDTMIKGLATLPPGLRRPAIIGMFTDVEGMEKFVDGVRYLASRAGCSPELLLAEIGAADHRNQVAAKISRIVERLPLPAALPPPAIGTFRRLDCAIDISHLAKTWNNCLSEYVFGVNEGTTAIYVSEEQSAVCLAYREGRLGWFLYEIKGPKNSKIKEGPLAEIERSFAIAGVPPSSVIEAIKNLL